MTFETGQIPIELKIALVTPVYKAGDRESFSNYRPISVLSCISKILMYKRLIKFLNKHNILNKHQYGFRNKRSTDLALIELTDWITKAIENNEYTLGIFLDLSEAFGTINHEILLKKLYFYGIKGTALNWFESYLQNQKQSVKCKELEPEL